MAQLNKKYVADEYGEIGTFEALPGGNYLLLCDDSEIKESAAKNDYLQIDFTVLSSDQKNMAGKKFILRLNLWHDKQSTVDMAEKELAAICRAMGIPELDDTDVLHEKQVVAKMILVPAKPGSQYGDSNRVIKYSAPKVPVEKQETPEPEPKPEPKQEHKAPEKAETSDTPPWG